MKPDESWKKIKPAIELCEFYRRNDNKTLVYMRFSTTTRNTQIKTILPPLGIHDVDVNDIKASTHRNLQSISEYMLIQGHKGEPGYDEWGAKKPRNELKRKQSSNVQSSPYKRIAAISADTSLQSIEKWLAVIKFSVIFLYFTLFDACLCCAADEFNAKQAAANEYCSAKFRSNRAIS